LLPTTLVPYTTLFRSTVTDFNGNCWRAEWDDRGQLCKRTSPRGAAWTYHYGAGGDLFQVTNPLGASTTLRRDEFGRVLSVTDARSEEHTSELQSRFEL